MPNEWEPMALPGFRLDPSRLGLSVILTYNNGRWYAVIPDLNRPAEIGMMQGTQQVDLDGYLRSAAILFGAVPQ